MNTALECIPCFVRQAAEAVSMVVPETERREILLRKLLQEISLASWQGSPPAMGQKIHRLIRRETRCADPYLAIKEQMNRAAQTLLPHLRLAMHEQADRQEAAVRIAIGGNLLDAGAKTQIAIEDLPRHMQTIWEKPLQGDVRALFAAATAARNILYLTDNAGEIFFDRVLLEALPAGKVTVAVRGHPVINDATQKDALAAGLHDLAEVIDNGSDAPGTVLEDCSAAFRQRFEHADLIIAKGQGNYETLAGSSRPIFFLFTVKCPIIAAHARAPVGTLMVKH